MKESIIVSEFEILEFIDEENVKILKVKANLKNNTLLYITEVRTIDYQKYSYHWQNVKGELLIRWDNSPHWKDIATFPHHKHIANKVLPSNRPSVEEILQEIEKKINQNNDDYL
ncbi:toxin-antitoxin system TumE family protein [Thermodesulfatator indicus]